MGRLRHVVFGDALTSFTFADTVYTLFARERQADLIVMAHHTREIDPEQALLGSTVEQVVLRSACPVASVNRLDKTGE